MVLGEFLADIGQAQVGELADQVHGDLPGLGDALALLGAPEHRLVHGVELADLGDDQAGGGQGVALGLEHIVNGPGNIGQVQWHIVQVPVGHDFLHGALDLPDVVGDIDGDVVAHIVVQVQSKALGLVFQNCHSGLIVRGLDVCHQTPLEPGLKPLLQGHHVAGLPVGGHDDLLVLLVELVEGMKELVLGTFLTGDELDIIDEEQVCLPVLAAELDIFAVLDGLDQLVGELVGPDVDDVGVGVDLADAVGDGVEQMGLAHAGRAVEEQGVIDLARGFGYRQGGAVGEAVTGAHDEIVEGELGVKVHGGGGLALLLKGGQLLVAEDNEPGVGVEDLLQGVLNVAGVPAADQIPAEIRGGVDDQVLVVQLHDLRVVQAGGDGDGAEALLHVADDFCPYIGGRKHIFRAPFICIFMLGSLGHRWCPDEFFV